MGNNSCSFHCIAFYPSALPQKDVWNDKPVNTTIVSLSPPPKPSAQIVAAFNHCFYSNVSLLKRMDLSYLTKNEMPQSTEDLSQELMTGYEHSWPPIWKSIKGKLATRKLWKTRDNMLDEFFSQRSLNPSLLSFHKIAMLFVFQPCLELNVGCWWKWDWMLKEMERTSFFRFLNPMRTIYNKSISTIELLILPRTIIIKLYEM